MQFYLTRICLYSYVCIINNNKIHNIMNHLKQLAERLYYVLIASIMFWGLVSLIVTN